MQFQFFSNGGVILDEKKDGTIEDAKNLFWEIKKEHRGKINWLVLENTIRMITGTESLTDSEKVDLIQEAFAAFTGRGR